MATRKSSKPTTRRKKKALSKGLGDTIEKVTEATGIKKVVKWLAGEDCGCDARKEKLNKLFKYLGVNTGIDIITNESKVDMKRFGAKTIIK